MDTEKVGTSMQIVRRAQARTLRKLRADDCNVMARLSRIAFARVRLEVFTRARICRRAAVLGSFLAMAGCSMLSPVSAQAATLDFEISAGLNITDKLTGRFAGSDGGFTGPRDTIEFALVWRPASGNWFVKLSHISHLSCGFPFGECTGEQSFKTIDGFSAPSEAYLERIEFGRRFRLFGGF